MKKYYLLFTIVLGIFLTSCSNFHIEKRHYRNGFYVDLGKDHNTVAATENNVAEPTTAPEEVTSADASAAAPSDINHPQSEVVNPAAEKNPEQISQPPIPVVKNEEAQPDVKPSHAESDDRKTEGKNPSAGGDTMLIILVILAILIPPLAVYLKEGLTTRFWIDLILALLGCGVFFMPYIGGFFLAAIIFALLIVLDAI